MHINLKKLGSQGDTIVEVLVVLAVLGLALSISYATASRSLKNTRQAQESAEASALAQSQIELLRSLSGPGNPQNIFQPAPFCISTTATVVAPLPAHGGACTQGTQAYDISIVYTSLSPPAPAQGGKFVVTVTWPDVLGQGNDTVTSVYRLYKQTP